MGEPRLFSYFYFPHIFSTQDLHSETSGDYRNLVLALMTASERYVASEIKVRFLSCHVLAMGNQFYEIFLLTRPPL